MTSQEVHEALSAQFADDEIEYRPLRVGKNDRGQWALLAPFIQARAIMNRLDEVVGPDGWQTEFRELQTPNGAGCLCRLSVKFNGEWVTKTDGADFTDIEMTKGGISDALKRAAVQFGIGRYLYSLDSIFATVQGGDAPRGVRVLKINDKKENVYGWCEIPALSSKAKPPANTGAQKPATTARGADPQQADYKARAKAGEAAYLAMFPESEREEITAGLERQRLEILRGPIHKEPASKIDAASPGTLQTYCQWLKTAIEARQAETAGSTADAPDDEEAQSLLAEIALLEKKQPAKFKIIETRKKVVGGADLTKATPADLARYREMLRQGVAA